MFERRFHHLLLLSIFALVLRLHDAAAQSGAIQGGAIGDYNGDSRSDFSLVLVNSFDKSTKWTVLYGNGTMALYTFNYPGDAFVPGRYFSGGNLNPAIVHVRGANLPLEWYIQRPTGSINYRTFGTPGSTPVQGDYDCDGVTDLAVRSEDGSSTWSFQLSTGRSVLPIQFGLPGDRVFGADRDGDSCDELFAVRTQGDQYQWYSRKLDNATVRSDQWGLKGDVILKPLDLSGDGKPELIVVRVMNSTQYALVQGIEPSLGGMVALGPSGTVAMAGNYTGKNGFAFFDKQAGTFMVRQSDGSFTATAWQPAGDAKIVRSDGTIANPSDRGSAPGVPTGQFCDVQLKLKAGRGEYIHRDNTSRRVIKTVLPSNYSYDFSEEDDFSSAFPFPGIFGGFPSFGGGDGERYTVKRIMLAKNGKVFETMDHHLGLEHGGRHRFYGKKTGKKYSKNIVQVIELTDGTRQCLTIPNPGRRYDWILSVPKSK
jgi:hypothetical protein